MYSGHRNWVGMDCNLKNVRLTFFKFSHFRFQNALEQIIICSSFKNLVDFFFLVFYNYVVNKKRYWSTVLNKHGWLYGWDNTLYFSKYCQMQKLSQSYNQPFFIGYFSSKICWLDPPRDSVPYIVRWPLQKFTKCMFFIRYF